MEKTRITEIDILKGLAIILVIFGHFYENKALRIIIHSFHMPLFVFVSGLFLRKVGLRKRLTRGVHLYVVPYCVTLIITLILECLIDAVFRHNDPMFLIKRRLLAGIYSLDSTSRVIGLPDGVINVGVIWFLLALFVGGIYWEIVMKLPKTVFQILLIVFLWIVAYFVTNSYCLPFGLTNGVAFCLWLYIGNHFYKYVNADWKKSVFYTIGGA